MTCNNMTKQEKILQQTCSSCQAVHQLLEIHQLGLRPCAEDCLSQWKNLLHSHFQEQIILHLAQKEAQNDPDNHE